MKKIVIIGGGLGGLSASIRLAAKGYSVTLLEKEGELGGKLKKVTVGDYSFDLGPSTITMIQAFREVFDSAGRKMEDYLEFYPINPMTRNIFPDGQIVDLTNNVEEMEEQIAQYSKDDARKYRAFLRESKRLYTISEQQFLNRLLPSNLEMSDFRLFKNFISIKPFTSLHQMVQSYFKHPHTLAMFDRYATYVGSSPYQAPAIFSMMASLEGELGIYGVKGGTYSIVHAFETLANELGVTVKKNVAVEKIRTSNKKVVGVETSDGFYQADHIIGNGDALTLYQQLIPEMNRPSISNSRINRFEPSLSGFVMLTGVNRQYSLLKHHNVFFPDNYRNEFKDIFEKKTLVNDPTIYICFSGYSEPDLVGKDKSNLIILVNAPYLNDKVNWEEEKERYFQKIIKILARRGLTDLTSSVEYLKLFTPENLKDQTGAFRGAIYGISSNHFRQAFFRIPNQSPDIEGLWFVGGSTHPGGGTPIVTKSGQLVAEAIINSKF